MFAVLAFPAYPRDFSILFKLVRLMRALSGFLFALIFVALQYTVSVSIRNRQLTRLLNASWGAKRPGSGSPRLQEGPWGWQPSRCCSTYSFNCSLPRQQAIKTLGIMSVTLVHGEDAARSYYQIAVLCGSVYTNLQKRHPKNVPRTWSYADLIISCLIA